MSFVKDNTHPKIKEIKIERERKKKKKEKKVDSCLSHKFGIFMTQWSSWKIKEIICTKIEVSSIEFSRVNILPLTIPFLQKHECFVLNHVTRSTSVQLYMVDWSISCNSLQMLKTGSCWRLLVVVVSSSLIPYIRMYALAWVLNLRTIYFLNSWSTWFVIFQLIIIIDLSKKKKNWCYFNLIIPKVMKKNVTS